jgi:AcrR family transcriptional regulator
MTATPTRRSQEERRATTRAKLLEAAAACLHQVGYAATTVGEVHERAGVARGTLLHHFPTKAELMVAATSYVVNQRLEQFRRAVSEIPPEQDRLHAIVDLAWNDLSSPVFFTALELWVAARTDPELRQAVVELETEMFDNLRSSYATVLGEEYAGRSASILVEFTVDLLTGLAMTTMLTGRLGPRQQVLDSWKRALPILVEGRV